ncbi:MAG: metal-dependent hydrolase, partial [Acidimicrobiia bacterium]
SLRVILWHVAGSIFLFRWVFRDPKVDLRLLALGAVLPDLIDIVGGAFLGEPTRQRWGHALMIPVFLAVVILLSTRRGRQRRQLMTVIVAWLFHLVLDGVWDREQTFLWPFFGVEFASWPGTSIWARARSDPWRFLKEGAGLVYLVLLWRSLPGDDASHRVQPRRGDT